MSTLTQSVAAETGASLQRENEVQISERPMLFSAPMVRAILRDQKSEAGGQPKTQTRRVMKVQPVAVEYYLHGKVSDRYNGLPVMRDASGNGWTNCGAFKCPWIGEGMCASERGRLVNNNTEDRSTRESRIWVKETFFIDHFKYQDALAGLPALTDDEKQTFLYYAADGEVSRQIPECEGIPKLKPSIFMPRWASRITLEIVSVRVERLQEISEEDAIAEGVSDTCVQLTGKAAAQMARKYNLPAGDKPTRGEIAIGNYRGLWNSINLKPSPFYETEKSLGTRVTRPSKAIAGYECFPWNNEDFDAAYPGVRAAEMYRGKPVTVTANPWVWVIGFRRVDSAKLRVDGETEVTSWPRLWRCSSSARAHSVSPANPATS